MIAMKSMMNRMFALLAVGFALLGCAGYQFVGDGPSLLDAKYSSIAVMELENLTAEIGLGAACARALQAQVANTDRVVSSPQKSALVLDGVIVDVEDRALAFAGEPGARQLEAEVVIEVTVVAVAGDREVFRDQSVGRARFSAAGDAAQNDGSRRAALVRACSEAMATALTAMEFTSKMAHEKEL